MKALAWWFRITGIVYLLLSLSWAPGLNALTFASKIPNFDAAIGGTAYRGFLDWMLGFGLDLAVTGIVLLVASRRPERATLLVWLVLGLELTRGIALDVYMIFTGYDITSNLVFVVLHLAIIVTGLLTLRSARRIEGIATK